MGSFDFLKRHIFGSGVLRYFKNGRWHILCGHNLVGRHEALRVGIEHAFKGWRLLGKRQAVGELHVVLDVVVLHPVCVGGGHEFHRNARIIQRCATMVIGV